MRVIGITGGVGTGKSTVLNYIKSNFNSEVIECDKVAKIVMRKGEAAGTLLEKEFGDAIFAESGEINPAVFSKIVYSSEETRLLVNSIVHPKVKEYILERIEDERKKGELEFYIIEAALLVEDNYDLVCDEIWYIYSSKENRIKRLKASRNYSDEKIEEIISSQLSEEEFKKRCDVVIDNDKELGLTYEIINEKLGTKGRTKQ